ncbi:hypothetical protein [Owenweeksia hongkongensis]|uniref:hypothetical protein n=1 Tax=Owenweeksia hongkongensis TaxID=253245 RepID=UPI003A902788
METGNQLPTRLKRTIKYLMVIYAVGMTSIELYSQSNSMSTYEFINSGIKNTTEITEENKSDEDDSEKKYSPWWFVEEVGLYGAGAVYGLVSADEVTDASSLSGSLGLNIRTNRILSNFYFSFNSQDQSEIFTKEALGANLLNPNISGHSFSLNNKVKLAEYGGINLGIQVADSKWQMDSTTTISASPFLFRLGFYLRPFDFSALTENKVNFLVNISYVHRSVSGDYGNFDFHKIQDEKILNRGYNGIEISGDIYLNSLHFFVLYTYNDSEGVNIPEFTGNQFVIGVEIAADVIGLK